MKLFSLFAGCSVVAGTEWSWPEDNAWDSLCSTGSAQSPIDIPQYCLNNMANMAAITPSWGTGIMTQVTHAHGIKLQTPSAGPFTTEMRGDTYTLDQCHFHYGSEHTFGGEQSDLCMHCVHTKDGAVDANGNPTRYGVLAFTWEISNTAISDPFLHQFVSVLSDFDDTSDHQNQEIDLSMVLNDQNMQQYIQYDGSLTTPPCTEAVDWHVLSNSRPISASMHNLFMTATGTFNDASDGTIGNARTAQALGSRVPTGCTWSAPTPAPTPGSNPNPTPAPTPGSTPTPAPTPGSTPTPAPTPIHWSWPEDNAWGQVANSVCSTGSAQSPINIPLYCLDNMNSLDAIVVDWTGTNSHTVGYSHGVQVTPDDNNLLTTMRGDTYTLLQCHFHHGSEHTFGGAQSDLCMHCVHTKNGAVDTDGNPTRYGVLAFTWEVSATANSDPFLDQFSATFDSMNLVSATHDDTYPVTQVDLGLVLNDQNLRQYIQYDGSLTTPPCSEVVDWHVFKHARPISQSMYSKITEAIGSFTPHSDGTVGNARSTQPLNSRVPTGCDWSTTGGLEQGGTSGNSGDRVSPLWVLPLVSFVGSMV